MKISGDDADRVCARPPAGVGAALLYGEPALVAERRDRLLAAVAGGADAERERLDGESLRRDPGALEAALCSPSFFAATRAVLVTEGGDGLVPAVRAALEGGRADAFLVVTAGSLKAGSALRKLFEGEARMMAVPCHEAALKQPDIVARLKAAGAPAPSDDGAAALVELAQALDRGAMLGEIEKLALYKHGDPIPITAEDVAQSGPASPGSDLDAALDAVSEGDPAGVRRALARLAAQGVEPDAVAAAALRRARQLHAAAAVMAAEGCGPQAALERLRPPIRFPMSRALAPQVGRWRAKEAEAALSALAALQARLRGGSVARGPSAAMTERALIRIAMTLSR